jgi:hypothetical protein
MIEILPVTYRFYWKHYQQMFFTKSLEVHQHHYNSEDNSMTLYLDDTSLMNIPNWTNYECRLKIDWFEKIKNDIKNEIENT